MTEDEQGKQAELSQYERNLQRLDLQLAKYGGEMSAPLHLLNQRDDTLAKIEELKAELQTLEPQQEVAPAVGPEPISYNALSARLKGIMGPDEATHLLEGLPVVPGNISIIIVGDGNIVGDNNQSLVFKDEERKEQFRKVAPALVSPPMVLPPLKVFISSTMKDLHPEREAVERALRNLALETLRAEAIGSQSASPYEVSLAMAQQCDIYLGIYGGRYGTVVPGDEYGRSITEIEYQTAHKLGKPILIYRKKGVEVDPAQEAFLKFAGDLIEGHTWREFTVDAVPDKLMAWVQEDVKAEITRHADWAHRLPARGRVLLASLGASPGAVTGLYYALAREGKPVSRVVTFSPGHPDVRDANGICEKAFRELGVSYGNRLIDAEDIESEADAQAFKSAFYSQLQECLETDAEVLVGITGGRSVMGALMAIVAQTAAPERVTLYHLDVDDDIEADGRLPALWQFQGTERWQELLAPPPEKCRLVKVPYVRFTQR